MYNIGRLYNSQEIYNTVPVSVTPGWYTHLAHALPIVVTEELAVQVILPSAHNIVVDQVLRGEEKLIFQIPHMDVPPELATEACIELAGRVYRIVNIDSRDEDEGRMVTVEAWGRWSDLSKAPYLLGRSWTNATAAEILGWLIFLTPWRVGEVAVTTKRSIHWIGGCNRLEAIRHVEEIFTAEVVFDTAARTVSIIPAGGVDQGAYVLRHRNLRRLDMQKSTADTVYRLYPQGQGGITIAPVNRGLDYIEIPAPTNPPASAVLLAEDFTDAAALLEYAQAVFATMNTQRISYVCKIMDISAADPDDVMNCGDVVTVYDEDTDTSLKTRVVKIRYNVEEPWNNDIELSTVVKDVGDLIYDLQRELLHRDARQLAPFNTLLSDVEFYANGMITHYEDGTRYIWLVSRDVEGRITRLINTAYGTTIDVRRFATEVPTA